jgi:hypothetical protein
MEILSVKTGGECVTVSFNGAQLLTHLALPLSPCHYRVPLPRGARCQPEGQPAVLS